MIIVIKKKDGSIAIMRLAGVAAETYDNAPEHLDTIVQAEIDGWSSGADDVASFRTMPDDAIPADRTFREAWRDDTPELSIDHCMTASRNIWRDRMRARRGPKLAALDIAFQRALETDADTAAIVAQKQALRDCTADPAIEAAQTPDDLKKVWPQELD